ncbi:unnamed protein product [Prorocentrum cordatum]|uniref:Rab-GAP TBC domain-containing protein n=2 Tax=Prorocentrum cordatum TaxID=2364126 RepID=A0ABN9T2Q5_9DINO|nr:unnamed protein product [Polarella glacialis]
MWLSRTLGVQSVVQWPKGAVPQSARQALQRLEAPEAPSGGEAAAAGSSPPTRAALLRAALEEGDLDAAGALAFREGCPEDGLRPWLWRAFIGRESSSSGKGARDDEAPKRRAAYAELRAQAPEGDAGRLRAEIEADARAVWRGEQFSGRPEVVDAVVALAMTQAQQCERYVRGTCEIAVLLLFAMSGGGTGSVADAQADAFWCLSRLLSEVQDSISDDSTLAEQARRAHELLRVYDPPLADLLSSHGLNALPTLRLGAVLFTRCGLTLVACVRLWDTLLADPARFAFCDCAVVAMLLLRRGDLLQRSSISGLAEMLLEIPSKADVGALVDTACAICAFERRKGLDYPPRPLEEADSGAYAAAALDQAMSAAQTRLTSIWGKVRAAGAEAAAQAPAWAQQARATAKEVAASAAVVAASAADQAAAAASAGIDQAAAAASAAIEAYERTHKERAPRASRSRAPSPARRAPRRPRSRKGHRHCSWRRRSERQGGGAKRHGGRSGRALGCRRGVRSSRADLVQDACF